MPHSRRNAGRAQRSVLLKPAPPPPVHAFDLGERFCRMWEFYLAFSEAAFRHGNLMVFQMQLSKRRDAVPLTRDYIAEWERSELARMVSAQPDQAA